MISDKKSLRRQCREQRQHDRLAVWHNAKYLHQLIQWLQPYSGSIGTYMAYGGEISLIPVMLAHWQQGYPVFLPTLFDQDLIWSRWQPDQILEKTDSGVSQPVLTDQDMAARIQPSLLLLPALAVNQHGERLGQGKGYYDRYLGQLHDPLQHLNIAVVPKQTNSIWPVDPWDLQVDGVYEVINQQFHWFPSAAKLAKKDWFQTQGLTF